MFRRHAVMFVALVIVVALWVDIRVSDLSLTQPAQAQAKSPETPKWEYCTIFGVNWDSHRKVSTATIGYLTPKGSRFETWDGGPNNDPLSVAAARLGLEGWECVGQVGYNNPGSERPATWFFKRRLP